MGLILTICLELFAYLEVVNLKSSPARGPRRIVEHCSNKYRQVHTHFGGISREWRRVDESVSSFVCWVGCLLVCMLVHLLILWSCLLDCSFEIN